MPHGSRRIGHVEVVALCDGVALGSRPASETFPGADDAVWAEVRERHPEVFSGDRWRLHVHCYLVRSGDRTILVDTGIGPRSAPAFAWSGVEGGLPAELDAAGATNPEVDTVVITHVHDDHLGWTVTGDGPTFPNARYLIHAADLDLLRTSDDEEDREIHAATVAPLERSGVLTATGDREELTPEIAVVHAPGHTPGHQVVLIDSGDARLILSGDLVNNPVMLLQPGVNSTKDMDPERAAATRASFLERIDREDRLVSTSHFPEPFGRFLREESSRHGWVPDEAPG